MSDWISIFQALNLILYVKKGKELNRTPWSVITNHLRTIESIIYETDSLPQFQVIFSA